MVADIFAFQNTGLLSLTQDARQLVEYLETIFDWAFRGEYRRWLEWYVWVSGEPVSKSIRDEIIWSSCAII